MTHPAPVFVWGDEAAMRGFVAARGFAHLAVSGPDGPIVAHVPVVVSAAGLRFHIARANRIAPHLDGARAVASVTAADHYVSPDWYGLADQVPTWNYRAAEIEGRLHRLDEAALVAQLDALSAAQEALLAPEPAWTRAKMAPGRFDAMLPAIHGFELVAEAWRGTAKFGQNKPERARAGVAAALDALGRGDAAAEVRAA